MRLAVAAAVLSFATPLAASPPGTPGGPEPSNLEAVMTELRRTAPDFELLLSYGTSRGASAGHLAVAVRDELAADDPVHSANFYADRAAKHAKDFHTDDLILRIPRTEYLYGTRSTLGPRASFGLDFGEAYKRTVVGVRVFGVPASERAAVSQYLQ